MLNQKRIVAVLMVVLLTIFVVFPSTLSAQVTDSPNQPDVVVASKGERNTYFPTIEKMQNDDLVVVYYDSPNHTSQSGRISMVQSSDQGETWSEPNVIMDTPVDDRDPNIIQTSDGTLLLSFFKYDWNQSPAKILGTYVSRSEDGGSTWSTPVKVETKLDGQSGWAATSDKILELDNGDLLIPLYGTTPNDNDERATVVRSTDGGQTWKMENEVEIAHDSDIEFQEPALVNLGNGHVAMMIRTAGGHDFAYKAQSYDNGRTWTEPKKTGVKAQASDLLVLNKGSKGMILHTWGDVSGQYSDGRPVAGELIFTNKDLRSPADPELIYSGECGDESYPSSVQLNNGQLFTVYYDACAGYIGGTYSNISDYIGSNNRSGAEKTKTVVEFFAKEGAFSNNQAVHALKIHLTAVHHYEKKKEADKVVEHMKGFKQLLNHQKNNKLISEIAYNSLKQDANALIQKWQRKEIN